MTALDLRGHGDSDWSPDGAYLSPYNLLDLVATVEALGAGPVTVVAHSYGGSLAARYAGLFPDRVRRIVFVDSLGPDPRTVAGWDAQGPVERTRRFIAQRAAAERDAPRRFSTIEAAAARMAKANPRLSPAQAHHLALHGTRRHPDGYGWKYDPRAGLFVPEDFAVAAAPFYRAIAAPALILHGRLSWTSDPAEDGRAGFFRDARVVTFEQAGHWIHHDDPDGFLAALDDFL